MKKLLALCLSVFMILGLVPGMAVIAQAVDTPPQVPATGGMYFEAEDNLTHKRYDADGVYVDEFTALAKSGVYHGGKYQEVWFQTSGAPTVDKLVVEIPFTVAASGPYSFELYARANTTNSGTLGTAEMYLNDTKLTDIARKDSTWLTTTAKANLEAGESYTLKLSVQKGGSFLDFLWDYVLVENFSSEFSVANAGVTTIQAEDYPFTTCVHSDTTTHSVEGTVASGIVTSDCTTHTDANGTNSWNITLNVAATGVYNIKTVAGGALTDANGGAEIKIDGEAIITDTTAAAVGSVETLEKTAYLTAGTHAYSYTVKSISGKATATIDYVEITPVVAGSADPDTTGTPVITTPVEVLTGASVTVSYTYAVGNTNPEGDSILRIMYNDSGVWKVGSTKTVTGGTGSIELPDGLKDKEIAIEFIPVDSTGKMGPVTSSGSIGILSRVVGTSAAAITPSDSTFGATVTITNNSVSLGAQNICVILVQYDADGAMLGITNATVSVANGTPQTVTPSFAKDPLATKVQMFIWNGTGYLDAGTSAYGSATTYMVP